MENTILNANEYRNVSLAVLTESKTNPRRIFEHAALKELAESIRSQGVLSPLLVRPITENRLEIIAGARRYRAAHMAEAVIVPVRIVNFNDAEALEAQLVENLISCRRSPSGRGSGIQSTSRLGRADVFHRADHRKDGQTTRLCGGTPEVD